jgi:CubicO group peptidase (beta-lactamase class C family)
MNRRSFRPVALLVLLTSFSVPFLWAQPIQNVRPEVVGLSADRLARLDTFFDGYVAEGKLPGGVLMVTRNGRIAYERAFGFRNIESGIEMSINSLFRIASQSKAIVSVGAMILQEEGALLISEPVSKYLPEFANTTVAVPVEDGGYEVVAATREITIRDLLTHTSGAGYGGGIATQEWQDAGITWWYFADREEPIRETVRRMAALPFESQPGEKFVYGYSTDILGAILEVASGMNLSDFLTDRIFRPLDMRDTHFYPPVSKQDRLASVYAVTAEGLVRAPNLGGREGQGEYINGPRMSYSGGAGLVSTATDYTRFLQMLINGGNLYDTRILSRKSVQHMISNHTGDLFPTPGRDFGLGFFISTDIGEQMLLGTPGEFGWGGAYHSTYWADPAEGLVVTYFTQVLPATGLDDHAKIRVLIYQAIQD